VSADEAYESARAAALSLMDQGFHLGGVRKATRDESHERGRPVSMTTPESASQSIPGVKIENPFA
jgi:hypothetical protein